jgi:lipopolysaccharide transport system permease protein
MMMFELVVFVIFAVITNLTIQVSIVFLIPMLVTLFVLTLGASFALSVLHVRYRDLQSIWAVLLQAGFWLAPIVYTADILPHNLNRFISINPFVPILDISHGSVLHGIIPTITNLGHAIGEAIVIMTIGYMIFRRLDRRIIEEI